MSIIGAAVLIGIGACAGALSPTKTKTRYITIDGTTYESPENSNDWFEQVRTVDHNIKTKNGSPAYQVQLKPIDKVYYSKLNQAYKEILK